ncbi:MAG: carbohydrate porin [Phycisphaerales bacterium]|nr:carbohydrate porin [Phycisphaerales bacterium]
MTPTAAHRPSKPGPLLFAPAAALLALAGAAEARPHEAFAAAVPRELPGHEQGTPREAPAAPTQAAPVAARAFWERRQLTGEWFGLRTRLADSGISLAGSYSGEFTGNVAGGVRRRGSYQHIIDADITADLGTLLGLPGATVFADFYTYSGRNPALDVGDFQWTSSIAADRSVDQLAELWWQQELFDKILRLKAGKIDASTEFGFARSAADFLNASATLLPTSLRTPSYPDPAFGGLVFAHPCPGAYVGGGIFDGATADGLNTGGRGPDTFFSDRRSDSWFAVGELGLTWERLGPVGPVRFAAGGWGHTGELARTDGGGTRRGSSGAYAILETLVWKRDAPDADDERGLWAFAQYGWADRRVEPAGHHVGGGLMFRGTFRGRDHDSAGLFVSWVDLVARPGAPRDELALELYYKLRITGWMTLQPDLQLVVNPSGRSDLDPALVAALRVQVTF